MFSLNFDPLFLGLDKVKEMARRLNANRRPSVSDADPRELQRMQDELRAARELQRMQDELRAARERLRMQVTGGRMLW